MPGAEGFDRDTTRAEDDGSWLVTAPQEGPDALHGEPGEHDRDEATTKTLLGAVIDAEAVGIERTIAIGGMGIAAIGAVIGAYTALAGVPKLGVPAGVVAVFSFGYFFSVRQLLRGRARLGIFAWTSPLVEQLFPPALTVMIVATEGAAYALGSWVPPILFVSITTLNIVRLRPWVALSMGAVSSVLFAAVVFIAVPMLDETPLPATELYSTRMQIARCLTLLSVGIAAGLGSVLLRRAMGRGAQQIRARDLFGKYRLGSLIAQGGMGSVFRATYCPEGGFERAVAIKRIHPHLAIDDRFVESFRSEAELCARLSHPNIVQVLDFGRVQSTYFMAMEYVDGPNLAELLDRARDVGEPLPPAVVAQVGIDIGEALHFAHQKVRGADGKRLRIIHRDLNPRNVLLAKTGQVKLTDFGIARALKGSKRHETRHVMGSVAYLAPEQARGDPLDERTDLFAFGLVLFEMLTLKSLFDRDNDVASLRAVVEAPIPRVTEVRPDLDEGWDSILAGLLRRNVDKRTPRADHAIAELKDQLQTEGVPAPDALPDLLTEMFDVAATVPTRKPPEPEATKIARQHPSTGSKPRIAASNESEDDSHVTQELGDIHALETHMDVDPSAKQ